MKMYFIGSLALMLEIYTFGQTRLTSQKTVNMLICPHSYEKLPTNSFSVNLIADAFGFNYMRGYNQSVSSQSVYISSFMSHMKLA